MYTYGNEIGIGFDRTLFFLLHWHAKLNWKRSLHWWKRQQLAQEFDFIAEAKLELRSQANLCSADEWPTPLPCLQPEHASNLLGIILSSNKEETLTHLSEQDCSFCTSFAMHILIEEGPRLQRSPKLQGECDCELLCLQNEVLLANFSSRHQLNCILNKWAALLANF